MAYAKELMGAGFSGQQAKTVGGLYSAVTATGSAQTDAATVGASLSIVAGADGTKGVILPNVEVGDSCEIFNNSGSTLKVYPPSGGAIAVPGTGLGSANAAYSHTTYATVVYTKVTSTQWLPNKSA